MNDAVIAANQLSKTFKQGHSHLHLFSDLNIKVNAGEVVAIVGSSGCGKSTLLHLLGGLDQQTQGEVFWQGQDISHLSVAALSRLRNQHLGFVYQFHHLLREFTALENVAMPLLIAGDNVKHAKQKAGHLLDQVGLHDRQYHKVTLLSGGERQRVALARALVTSPKCVLADEPTGNLDPTNADAMFHLMLDLQKQWQMAFLIVTHDVHLAEKADRLLTMAEGKLVAKDLGGSK